MATTPLNIAARALSLATFVAAGFAVWGLSTQTFASRETSTSASPAPSSDPVSHAEASSQNVPVAAAEPTVRLLPKTKETSTTSTVPANTKSRQPSLFVVAVDDESSPPRRSESRIQPPLARPTRAELDSVPKIEFSDDSASLENDRDTDRRERRGPSATNATSRAQDAESARMNSQFIAMQRKIDQLAQAQVDQQTDSLQQATQLLQQLQQEKNSDKLDKLLQEIRGTNSKPEEAPPKPGVKSLEPDASKSLDADEDTARPRKSGVLRAEPIDGQSERFSIEFQDAEISEALAMLGQMSGINILVGRGISGRVPAANLQDVTAEQALDAITKSLGYVYEREGSFVFVSTAAEALQRKQASRKTVTKVFRPRYVTVKDLQMLITPLLTKPIGLVAVTIPTEIGLEQSRTKAGGDSLSQTDALLVVDYPEVIAQVEAVITDIDVPPSQVVIEAMILSVKLTDSMKLGVNFALLNGSNKQLVTTGNGSQINSNVGFNKNTLLPVVGDFAANTAGLKYGFINGDLAGFVEALETLAETSVVASPSVRVLNKQKAELIIGERLGYKTTTFNGTQAIENINFLEVGTKLLLRPFVAQDGLVRMEIHPERSDGSVDPTSGLPKSRTTEVTSNVMVRDGSTIVIGGLIEEQANQSQSRVPVLGALPIVGNLFKNKSNDTVRTELIVLITPRIIHDPEAECEGDLSRSENERRHQEYRDKLSPINRHSLARIEYERAARYFEEGDVERAKRHIDESLRHDRTDKESLRLRDQIATTLNDKNWFKKLRRKPPTVLHRLPSAPTSVPNGETLFEQELSVPSLIPSSPSPPIPPAPATDRDGFQQPSSSTTRKSGKPLQSMVGVRVR